MATMIRKSSHQKPAWEIHRDQRRRKTATAERTMRVEQAPMTSLERSSWSQASVVRLVVLPPEGKPEVIVEEIYHEIGGGEVWQLIEGDAIGKNVASP